MARRLCGKIESFLVFESANSACDTSSLYSREHGGDSEAK